MSAPRYIDPALSKSYEEIREAAILEDADEAIRKLHTHVRMGHTEKCIDLYLRFPNETSKQLQDRGFLVDNNNIQYLVGFNNYHITKVCFK